MAWNYTRDEQSLCEHYTSAFEMTLQPNTPTPVPSTACATTIRYDEVCRHEGRLAGKHVKIEFRQEDAKYQSTAPAKHEPRSGGLAVDHRLVED